VEGEVIATVTAVVTFGSTIWAFVLMQKLVEQEKLAQLPVVPSERDRLLAAAREEIEAIDRSIMQPETVFPKPKPRKRSSVDWNHEYHRNFKRYYGYNNKWSKYANRQWRLVVDEMPQATLTTEASPPLEEIQVMKCHVEAVIEQLDQAEPVGTIFEYQPDYSIIEYIQK
jgi:hypothetical protein